MTENQTLVNEPFLREVLAWIEIHPERWDQRFWLSSRPTCGTSYCLGGWAYVLGTGAEPLIFGPSHIDKAQELLGLNDYQAHDLFYFISVVKGPDQDEEFSFRPATFADLCAKVEQVTGVRFKSREEL